MGYIRSGQHLHNETSVGRLFVALSVLGVALAATSARQSAPSPPQPVFRAGVDHVELDVVVTDAQDKPVKGLAPADFAITEHGRPQTIADFQFVSIPPSHRAVADVKAAVPTVDVVTNTRPPLGRQWVLVIDDLHIMEQHLQQTKQVVLNFLEALPTDDQVAIVFVGRSDLSQDFTSDLGAQVRTVNRIKDALGLAYDALDTPPMGQDAVSPESGDLGQRDRHRYAMATIDVLKNVCASLVRSTYPRKAVVYLSEGMTYSFDQAFSANYLDFSRDATDTRDVFDQLTKTFESARKAGMPVYPIDPRGIPDCTSVRGDCFRQWPTPSAASSASSSPVPSNIQAGNTTLGANIYTQFAHQLNSMRTLAENTGGLAFVNRPNMAEAVRELVDDNNSFYLLGYYPEPFGRDGQFHDVKVTVNRPGMRVRARAGYIASKATSATAAETKATLADVLGAALPVAGLSLRVFAAPVAPSPHGMTTVVTLEVTYPAPLEGGKIDDTLQFGMLALDHDGKVKGSTRRAFHFTASVKGTDAVTYAINDTIDLPSQPLTLRVGVASQALGTAASLHLPVEVIGPGRDELQMSAVVLGFAGPTRQAAVPPGALKDLVPFQPTTTRTLAASDTLRLFARLFWGSKDTAVDVTLTVNGELAPEPQHLTLTSLPAPNGHRQAVLDTTLPLAGLLAGRYTLGVAAQLSNGQTARRALAFEIK